MTCGGELFSDKDQARAYADNRPSYPDELFDAVYDYAGEPHAGVALDVATGAPSCTRRSSVAIRISRQYSNRKLQLKGLGLCLAACTEYQSCTATR